MILNILLIGPKYTLSRFAELFEPFYRLNKTIFLLANVLRTKPCVIMLL